MKYPKEFQCMGHTIKIRYYKKLKNLGEFHPDKDLIKVLKTEDMSHDQIWGTIMHEATHCFMIHMNMEHLYKDETFIDILGNIFLQFLKTTDIF